MRNQRGFSLTTLAIGIVLLGFLAVAGLPYYKDFSRARNMNATQDTMKTFFQDWKACKDDTACEGMSEPSEANGYRFSYKADGDKFDLRAWPATRQGESRTGDYAYYINETGRLATLKSSEEPRIMTDRGVYNALTPDEIE